MTMTALVVQREQQTLSGVSHLLLIDDRLRSRCGRSHSGGSVLRSLRQEV